MGVRGPADGRRLGRFAAVGKGRRLVITRVTGKLLLRELDRVEVLTSGGVAYEIATPRSTYDKLPPIGKDVELRTHQVVREDGIFLFGFLDETERSMFGKLLTASGVGPRLALAMLSALSPANLVRAIREKDIPILTTVSGVGKRTAERLAIDLANKLDDIAILPGAAGPTTPGIEEALQALTVLGYSQADADRAVRAAAKSNPDADVQQLIKIALGKIK